jgi:predicted TIM-barrel fold metal-dependent hydrolase
MIIDSHVHIREVSEVNGLIRSASLSGIGRLLISSLGIKGYTSDPTPDEVTIANNSVLEALDRFPDEIVGLCYVTPQHVEESITEMDRCIADGPMKGIKLWVAAKASDPEVEPIARKAIELDIPILQHAWNKATGSMENESTPADVASLARKFPGLRIHMAHLYGAGFRGIADIAPYPNVYVDISGGEPEAGILEYSIRAIGAERILFGSDAPGRGFAVQLGKVSGADISEEDKEMILWQNTKRVYKL